MILIFRTMRRRKLRRLYNVHVNSPKSRISWHACTAVGYLIVILVAHSMAMVHFEGMSFGDGLWLTLTSITTVGYGDISAASAGGRTATALIIYVGGIFVAGKFAGDFFDYRISRRTAIKTGKWDYSAMDDHIVIIGTERDYENFFIRLVEEFRREEATRERDIILVSSSFHDGLPLSLENLMVNYVSGAGGDPTALDRAAIGQAEIIVVLAWNEHERRSDGKTFDIIHRVREENANAKIFAECVDDNNRDRLIGAGASVVVRPMRSYPEMIVGSLLNPGSSEILENLFTGEGEKIVCVTETRSETWEEVVMRYVGSGHGIPIAYREKSNGEIVTVPDPKRSIEAAQVFVLTSGLPAGSEA